MRLLEGLISNKMVLSKENAEDLKLQIESTMDRLGIRDQYAVAITVNGGGYSVETVKRQSEEDSEVNKNTEEKSSNNTKTV